MHLRATGWPARTTVVASVVVSLTLLHCITYRPEVVYEGGVFKPAASVDLLPELKRCTRRSRVDIPGKGFVEIRYPKALDSSSLVIIRNAYLGFFPLAEEILGNVGRAEMIVYVLLFEDVPKTYYYRLVRRGEKWTDRYLGVLLLNRAEPLPNGRFWSQIATDVHELAHVYFHSTFRAGPATSRLVRWLDDGVADLVAGEYLERNAPSGLARTKREIPCGSFDPSVFDWPDVSPEITDAGDLIGAEGIDQDLKRYATAYALVRYVYERDKGSSLRRLLDEVRARPPVSGHDLDAMLRDLLGLNRTELLEATQGMLCAKAAPDAGT